jgi:chromosome segregation ATPase
MTDRRSGRAMESNSPVSPIAFELAEAVDSSFVSSTLRRLRESDVAGIKTDDFSMIEHFKTIIEDLQSELNCERARVVELESTLESLKAELEVEKRKIVSERALVENLRHEKNHSKQECNSVSRELQITKQELQSKKDELEHMTRYFERRMQEMKRSPKELSSDISTPPIPLSHDSIKENEDTLMRLINQLSDSNNAIRRKDEELRSVVESYEKQVQLLRKQLKTSDGLLERISLSINMTRNFSIDDDLHRNRFSRRDVSNLVYPGTLSCGGPNPFSKLN